MQTISEIFASAVRHFADKPFIIEGGREITYRDFNVSANRLANGLRGLGVTKGQRVGLYLPSSSELALGYHACQKLGAIAVPMSSMYRNREVTDIVTRTDMAVLLTDDAGEGVACEVRLHVPGLREVLSFGTGREGTTSLTELLANASPECDLVPCDANDVAVLFFTSGTTGKPKGAMQRHLGVYSTLRDMEVYSQFRSGGEVILGVLPIFNNFGATCLMMATAYNGGTLVLSQRWDTERVLEDISRYAVTYMAGTPTMYVYMWKAYDKARHDLSSLRLCVAGGAPVPSEVIDGCREALGIDVTQIYGATETSGYVTGEPVVGIRKRGSAGTAFGSTSVSALDDRDQSMPTGDIGEIVISGDTLGVGYWRDEEATKGAFTTAGWRSGDLGYLDSDGYLFIVDRKKDLIISGGYNIHPIEVEDVLYHHPMVGMCAVVGIRDDVKGEVPVAFIVPTGGPSAGLAQELIEFCRERMAAFKAPRHVEFLSELPLGPSGKILKRELREYPVTLL